MQLAYAVPALRWLERQPPPSIIAAASVPATAKYRMYVPDNVADKVAAAWSGGREASIADYRTEKDVRPRNLMGEAVCYVFPLTASDREFEEHRNTLSAAARSITHLGWGVDMVTGNATVASDEEVAKYPGDFLTVLGRRRCLVASDEEVAKYPGERWQPTDDTAANGFRVPMEGTLNDLVSKHTASLNRLSGDTFLPVPPLSVFRVVGYRRETDAAPRPWAAFRIVSTDPDAPNPSFDTALRCRDVAAWVRNATSAICQSWPDLARFVHGHDAADDKKPLKADERFMYLPLPTINPLGVESIRRVLIVAPPGFQDRIDWVRRRLPGQELVFDGETKGMLTDLKPDGVLRNYTRESPIWSTVTPVILPGYDDPDHIRTRLRTNRDASVQKRLLAQIDSRIEGLLRKAIKQAGYGTEIADSAQLEWRKAGFRPGVDLAHRYVRPENLQKFPAYHVRIRFANPFQGPMALGAGRYRGFGLFAADDGTPTRK
jgi:CRISPR-associated protein Csb2